jgi:protein-disulfide isomerase
MSIDARRAQLVPAVTNRDHTLGPTSAPATLVEYGDYQCPFCGQFQQVLEQLLAQMGDQVRFCYRNFPLPQHQYAEIAAEAAESADAQGKFWPMHDLLFHRQNALDPAHLEQYAQSLDLDVPAFEKDLQHHRFADRLRAEVESGERSGVEGTPTLFINDVLYEGPLNLPSLAAALEDAAEMKRTW